MKVSTEQEWQTARKELLAAERELEEHAKRIEEQRRELPWVPVEKQYRFCPSCSRGARSCSSTT
jgi:predicted dithiol-disulfide oxidoreductase (DUF899 family)